MRRLAAECKRSNGASRGPLPDRHARTEMKKPLQAQLQGPE
ncbi:hypothetical protein JL2886_01570 [Phaeobacter gallaeciensis]|uniref:Uncharacterized protein n=1 Tax=Phaeobacter gallaeciensis TaxID=60890 RepID=A0A1B0ZQM6_9RHOB|nr:hypothetical protein JL2886_01570 [Phaeobacter gallaeciensis]